MAAVRTLAAGASDVGSMETQSREFAWTDEDFDRVQSLRDTGHQSFRDYLSWLEGNDGPEWQEFVNALTTNLTSFFREQHHFEILSNHLKSKPPSGTWRVWCSASSTGEEPYSIVMTALEALGPRANFFLTASDIDSKVLASAEQGV